MSAPQKGLSVCLKMTSSELHSVHNEKHSVLLLFDSICYIGGIVYYPMTCIIFQISEVTRYMIQFAVIMMSNILYVHALEGTAEYTVSRFDRLM